MTIIRTPRRPRFITERLFEDLESRVLLTVSPSLPWADGLAIDRDVYDPGSILVRYRDEAASCRGTGCLDIASVTQRLGGSVARDFAAVRGLHQIRLPSGLTVESALERYRTDPNVLYAEPDYRVHATAIPDDPLFEQLWGLNNEGQTGGTVDADADVLEGWDVTTGGSVVVAVIDTGVDYTHEDLAANMWVNPGEIPGDGIDNDGNSFVDDVYGYDFANNDGDPMDDHRHGTHVAGTIGAVGNNGLGVVGVNWDVQIMAIKFLDASGNGSTSDAIEAIQYAVANGAKLSNASWGGNEPFSQALYDAIADARDAGHIIVAGAGNGDAFGFGQNNDANAFYPASYDLENIISVAATDHNDNRAGFSNYGATSVDLAAPGVDILSTTPANSYESLSGTSMATPHVAGVVSLIWQQHPTWTYDQVVAQVLSTVDVIPSMQGITTTGGRLNAAAALGNPVPPPPPPPPGTIPLVEDFQDNLAQHFQVRSGAWSVGAGQYSVTPTVDDAALPSVSTIRVESPLPEEFEVHATVNANAPIGFFFNYLSNGYIVFDYQSDANFKYAGLDVSGHRWVIGERTPTSWQTVASLPDATLAGGNDYGLRLIIRNNSEVTLRANGVPMLTNTFSESVTDGELGLGVRNSATTFDDVQVVNYVPPPPATTLPFAEDFSDGLADHFEARGTSGWMVSDGVYVASPPVGADAVSTVHVSEPLPSTVEILATINAAPSGTQYSNALIVFDYQSNVDFKFAGAYVGTDRWVLGHRTASGWTTDASVTGSISANVDYDLQVLVQDSGDATLSVNGVPMVTHAYGESLTDGAIGVGTINAPAHFDNIAVQAYVPPPPPPSTPLPVWEDFSDGVADFFQSRVGDWAVTGERYHATPTGDAVSTISIDGQLPSDLEFHAVVNMDAAANGFFSNGVLVFDYQSPTDFKFAGAYAGSDKWVIGHRTSSGWYTDATLVDAVNAGTDYAFQVVIEHHRAVTLSVNGLPKVAYTFADDLTDGALGLATYDAIAHYDDVLVQAYVAPPPPPTTGLPVTEDFSDGLADFFQPRAGSWMVDGEEYHAVPAGDAVSTLNISDVLPSNLEIQATVNIKAASGGLYSNGLVIFDYQSPTDFKFAGAYVGSSTWVIGHRSTTGWVTDTDLSDTILSGNDYALDLVIEADTAVALKVNGVAKLTHLFADAVTDGLVGLGTYNAVAHFDDVMVHEYVPVPPPPTASLPYTEDFTDGVADFLQAQVGTWTVAAGRYHDTPAGDAVATLNSDGPLPSDVEVQAVVNMDNSAGAFYSNGVLVFDYHGPTNFKFAGAYTGTNKWVIGQRTTAGRTTFATASGTINAGTDYQFQLVIEHGSSVTLNVDGVKKVAYDFADTVTDGQVGLGTFNAFAHFDDLVVQGYVPPPPPPSASLPFMDDFTDGIAEFFQPQVGAWNVSAGRYHDTPAGDAVTTINVGQALPTDLVLRATVNMNGSGGGFYSNGVLVFDYQSPTDFKYAGAYAGSAKWVIGHRTAAGRSDKAVYKEAISAGVDYSFEIAIQGDSVVKLIVDGVEKTSYNFGGSLSDGDVGLGTFNALAHFDDVVLEDAATSMATVAIAGNEAGPPQVSSQTRNEPGASFDPLNLERSGGGPATAKIRQLASAWALRDRLFAAWDRDETIDQDQDRWDVAALSALDWLLP